MGKFQEEMANAVAERLKTIAPGSSSNLLTWQVVKKVSSAFTGATSNAHGDKDGTLSAYPLFTVKGTVMAHVFGVCNVLPVGASGTLEVGVTGNTAVLIAQETASQIAAGNVYTSATQSVGAARLAGDPLVIAGDISIIETVATTDLSAGQIDYYCLWAPLTESASVVAA